MHLLVMLGLLPCQGGDKEDGDVGDTTMLDSTPDTTPPTDDDTDVDVPAGLNGTPPATPVPLPASFAVVNREGVRIGRKTRVPL